MWPLAALSSRSPLLLATPGSTEAVGASLGMAVLVLRAAVDAFRMRMEREHLLSWQPEAQTVGQESSPEMAGLLVAGVEWRTF